MRDHQQDMAVGVDDDRGHQARGIVTRKKSVGRVALVIHERALEQDRGRCHPARRAPCDNIVIRGATFAVALPICAAVTAPPPPLAHAPETPSCRPIPQPPTRPARSEASLIFMTHTAPPRVSPWPFP